MRSFTDILGETSLERKCRFLFGLCLFVLIAGSFWWYGSRTERIVYATTRTSARQMVDAYMLQYHSLAVGRERPGADPIKRLTGDLGSPAFESSALLRPDAGPAEWTAYSLLDQAVVDYFRAAPPTIPAASGLAGEGEYREYRTADASGQRYHYYQPIRWQSGCNKCHVGRGVIGEAPAGTAADHPRYAENDLMAVVKVVTSDEATRKAINWNRAILLATAIMTVFLSMLAAYAIVRYVIVKPLAHLREVSEEVRRGNVQARADIHTADEFEELGVAFNRMLRGLIDSQEELRKANGALDGKVDELAQANLNLYEMNRLKGDFLATMSHELRTPLNSILGFSEVLESIQSLDDRQRRYVENIRKSGRMLLEMINDILDLAKIEAGKMEVRPATFALEPVVSAQCDMVRPLAERKRIEVSYAVGPGLEAVEQDMGKVQQILANLLSNAVKFTPEGGRVEVTARAADDQATDFLIEVADTGVGIAEEELQSIFEKFRQGRVFTAGDDAMTREYSGTGLGLSIVRELCRLLGGDVTLASQLGRGSTFTVRLPLRLDVPERPVEPALAAAS